MSNKLDDLLTKVTYNTSKKTRVEHLLQNIDILPKSIIKRYLQITADTTWPTRNNDNGYLDMVNTITSENLEAKLKEIIIKYGAH